MTPICEYITKEILPKDKKKARALRRKASRYAVINGTLYKKYFLGPWLRCVEPLQANYVLREIHEGSCSMYSGPRSVVAKAIRTGCYWPTMHTDARKLIRECNDCQVHRPILRNPQQNLTPIMSPWPFYKWGIDIAGPFPKGPGKVKFLIVAIDYFTKWIEAKPVATIMGNQVKEALGINLDLIEEKREQVAIQEAKARLRWKNTTTPKSAAQASNRGTWSTVTMTQATPRTEVNLYLNGKDRMKSRKH
ncbi:reverse transcriptase domain-containing protein [Tanacetum coccineum]